MEEFFEIFFNINVQCIESFFIKIFFFLLQGIIFFGECIIEVVRDNGQFYVFSVESLEIIVSFYFICIVIIDIYCLLKIFIRKVYKELKDF